MADAGTMKRQHQGVVGASEPSRNTQHQDVPADQREVGELENPHAANTSCGPATRLASPSCQVRWAVEGSDERPESRRIHNYHNGKAVATEPATGAEMIQTIDAERCPTFCETGASDSAPGLAPGQANQ